MSCSSKAIAASRTLNSSVDISIDADRVPGLDNAFMQSRDSKLVAAVESLLVTGARPRTIGIVYGAAHMPAVTGVLMGKHHFRVVRSEWLTVFDYAEV